MISKSTLKSVHKVHTLPAATTYLQDSTGLRPQYNWNTINYDQKDNPKGNWKRNVKYGKNREWMERGCGSVRRNNWWKEDSWGGMCWGQRDRQASRSTSVSSSQDTHVERQRTASKNLMAHTEALQDGGIIIASYQRTPPKPAHTWSRK